MPVNIPVISVKIFITINLDVNKCLNSIPLGVKIDSGNNPTIERRQTIIATKAIINHKNQYLFIS